MNNQYKGFVLQQDQADCGVACLLSVIRYYGGDNNLEELRKLSGTSVTGTTLLGLYQAAKKCGFNAEGCEADTQILADYNMPCILHVKNSHYVVFYNVIKKGATLKFVIGDPEKGIIYLPEEDLKLLWISGKCLELTPDSSFKKAADIRKEKIRWIYSVIRNDIALLGVATILGILISVLGLALAIFSQRLIDDILPHKAIVKLEAGLALILLLLLLKEFLSLLRQRLLISQSRDFNNRIINFFYDRLLYLPKPFFDSRKTGDLTARLNDTARIQKVISQLAGNVVTDAVVVLVSCVFIFIYSPVIGLATIIIAPLFYLLIHFNLKKIVSGQTGIMQAYAQCEGNYISTLQGIDTIKNHNKLSLFSFSNKRYFENYQANIFLLGKLQVTLSFVVNIFCVCFLTGVLAYCSYEVLNNQLKVGQMMAVIGISSTLLPGIANLALTAVPVNEARVAFNRMFEFTLALPESLANGEEPDDINSITLSHVAFRYPGRPPVLADISFRLQKGEAIALIGENGCGKSTLTQIIQKHLLYESGSIHINDTLELWAINTSVWRKLSCIVPQQPFIFNSTILENIAFDDAVNNTQAVIDFLATYGFDEFFNRMPQSVYTLVGEEGLKLSGGQKQLVALARAAYSRPKLLILDEVTAAMDSETEFFTFNLLQKLKADITIIFISHKLHLLNNLCDRMVIITKGMVGAMGSAPELLKQDNLYSTYMHNMLKIYSTSYAG
ncbi:peptidase domain-containing ABC transporter [Mucilaginibacter celer]|uniref:ATP-binding cassette domain-containing protein n=1 Tax=Mucilaginibacter celer TaxID=2305508 RepID=A0A494VT71_9SPHI|nr:peptidase domain-containing ABC transporter [Mucilaginibacter celer]AYL97619.1 ATP-binding cassette domain-containing protein [Mucilaginibacter celer]